MRSDVNSNSCESSGTNPSTHSPRGSFTADDGRKSKHSLRSFGRVSSNISPWGGRYLKEKGGHLVEYIVLYEPNAKWNHNKCEKCILFFFGSTD